MPVKMCPMNWSDPKEEQLLPLYTILLEWMDSAESLGLSKFVSFLYSELVGQSVEAE